MGAWNSWFGTLGDALVDGANPISHAKAISPDGSVMDATSAPSGYTVLKADSLDAAVALSKGCPVPQGGAVVLVWETIPLMERSPASHAPRPPGSTARASRCLIVRGGDARRRCRRVRRPG